eukprot:TRINITY_DN55553_c0_g1_i1.p1 TRINITY_DN55553_c0_g1~~TRINITY_DN55553_c0_g1_i1.p1  ORF type:complete len:512 (+),score=61.05 TRINITY_DN55553_c0_g1_i1:89-1624(+)
MPKQRKGGKQVVEASESERSHFPWTLAAGAIVVASIGVAASVLFSFGSVDSSTPSLAQQAEQRQPAVSVSAVFESHYRELIHISNGDTRLKISAWERKEVQTRSGEIWVARLASKPKETLQQFVMERYDHEYFLLPPTWFTKGEAPQLLLHLKCKHAPSDPRITKNDFMERMDLLLAAGRASEVGPSCHAAVLCGEKDVMILQCAGYGLLNMGRPSDAEGHLRQLLHMHAPHGFTEASRLKYSASELDQMRQFFIWLGQSICFKTGGSLLAVKGDRCDRYDDLLAVYNDAVAIGVWSNVWQRPNDFPDSRLESKPFREPTVTADGRRIWKKRLAFVKKFEDNAETIRREAIAVLESGGFYIGDGTPPTVVHNGTWKEFALFKANKAGGFVQGNVERMPFTSKLIKSIPQITGFVDGSRVPGGEVQLLLLPAGSSLKPHCGDSHRKLIAHLGIKIPAGDVGLRVQTEIRRWEEGRVVVFDDSLEHAVWNNADEPRVVLLFTLHHPALKATAA